jgi:MoaA/NifB/PqqE/SkfB family radical SAM enzyme
MLAWHVRYLFTGAATPMSCGFYITTVCNLRCSFCNIRRYEPAYTATQEEAFSFVEQLGKLGTVYFSISGGEPFLVPYVIDLLAHAKSKGILYTHVVSNGMLINPERAKALQQARLSEISMSIDGPEEFHDKARGVQGCHKHVLDAVEHLRTHAPSVHIVLNTIFDPHAPENALHAVEAARKLGVQIKVQPRNDHPDFGIDDPATSEKSPFSAEARERIENAVEQLIRSPHVVNSRPFLRNYLTFLFNPKQELLSHGDCIYGNHHMESFAGRVYPCLEGMSWENGFELGQNSLSELLRSTSYVKKLKELRRCQGCLKNYYVCYYEPRMNFPIWNFIRSRIK